MYKNTVDVNSFWTDFSRVLSECGIDEKHAEYYLKLAQKVNGDVLGNMLLDC